MNKYFIIENNVVTNIILTSTNTPPTQESEIAVLETIGGVKIGDIHNPDTNTFAPPLKGGFNIEKDIVEIEDKLYVGTSNVQIVLRHNYPINSLLSSDFTLSNAIVNNVVTNNLKTLIDITIDDVHIFSNSTDPIVLSLNKNITSLTQNLQAEIHPISFYFDSSYFESIPGDELPSEE